MITCAKCHQPIDLAAVKFTEVSTYGPTAYRHAPDGKLVPIPCNREPDVALEFRCPCGAHNAVAKASIDPALYAQLQMAPPIGMWQE